MARQYLDYLLSEENFEEAAMQCPRILGKNKELWEAETLKFHKLRQLKVCVFCVEECCIICKYIHLFVLHNCYQICTIMWVCFFETNKSRHQPTRERKEEAANLKINTSKKKMKSFMFQ